MDGPRTGAATGRTDDGAAAARACLLADSGTVYRHARQAVSFSVSCRGPARRGFREISPARGRLPDAATPLRWVCTSAEAGNRDLAPRDPGPFLRSLTA